MVVALPDRSERELDLEAAPSAPIGEVVAALIDRLGSPAGSQLYRFRTAAWLEDSRAWQDAGLLHGDRVFLGPASELPVDDAPHTGEGPGWELVVVGGSNIGSRWPLSPGATRVGRSRDCDIAIDDPALSRIHLIVEVGDDEAWVEDAGSTNGTFSDGIRLADRHPWKPGEVIEAGGSLVRLDARSRPSIPDETPSPDGRIVFNRPPRVAAPSPSLEFEAPSPPSPTEGPRLPLAAAAVPLVIAVALWRLFPDSPSLLLIVALSPVMALMTYLEERRRGRRGARRDEREWQEALTALVTEISSTRASYAERSRARSPGVDELQRRVFERASNLWERRSGDEDFLLLRLGWGDRPWPLAVRRPPEIKGHVQEQLDRGLEPLGLLPSVPLTVDTRSAGVVGLSGDRPSVEAAARWLILQLATLHSPEDLILATMPAPEAEPAWRWLSWLPHPSLGIATDATGVLDELVALVDSRRDPTDGSQGLGDVHPAVVTLVDDRARVSRTLLTRLLRQGPAVGVYVIYMGAERARLPGETGAIVEFPGAEDVVITLAATGEVLRGAREGIGEEVCGATARALAPLIDASPIDSAQELPRSFSLYDALGTDDPGSGDVLRHWEASSAELSAPIGADAADVTPLDLGRDGPHVLVAGTTGSGKSELLQTLVVSLAWHYSPTRINLLLIDYKGGAAFKDCADLPHAVGLVTDLDAELSRRALVSLEAELKRRERRLRDARAHDIAELESNSDLALPRLILVFDEFAALVKELPDFVDEVIDLAQRGRSLGIHLVLATQRPAGVINDAIRANTNLRIALRVADEPDSNDVVGTSDAVRIPRSIPGRGLLRRGHGEVVAFQTAFAGAPAASTHGVVVRERTPGTLASGTPSGPRGTTQLHAAVGCIRDVAEREGLPAARSPWLPPLPELLPLESLQGAAAPVGVFGLLDRPELQQQDMAAFDPATDLGLLVYGAAGSGKTTLLRTMAASLATATSPDELHLYGLDFAGGGLRPLRALSHCGDVVAGEEHERVERLFSMMQREIEHRKQLFASHGAVDLDRLHQMPEAPLIPRIMILLDGYEGFGAAFERVNMGELVDLLPRLVAEGRAVGIHLVVSCERRAGIPSALAALMPTKIVLRMSDEDEYLALGMDLRAVKGLRLPAGRGFLNGELLQVAIVGSAPGGAAQHRDLEGVGSALPAGGRRSPRAVMLLPASVPLPSIPPAQRTLVSAFGLREEDLTAAAADLELGHFLVAGPYRSGRSSALLAIATGLLSSTPRAQLWLLAPSGGPLPGLDIWTRAAVGALACERAVTEIAESQGDDPVVVFIDDADELAEGDASYALEPLVRDRSRALRVVAAGESLTLHRVFGGWLGEVRKHKQGLLLDPDLDLDGDLLGVKLPRRQKRSFPPGRGYQVGRGRVELVQTARP